MQRIAHANSYRRGKKTGWTPYRIIKIVLIVLAIWLIKCAIFPPIEAVYPEQIGDIPVITDLLPEDYASRSGIKREIKWIVIHETGNTAAKATARAHNLYLHDALQKDTPLSWHYTVDDREIYHHLPDDEVAWHASDKLTKDGGNACGVAIEICVNENGDYQKAVDHAAQLTAYLLKAYRLDITDVKQHYDFCGKNCPENLRKNENWQNFLALVSTYEKQKQ